MRLKANIDLMIITKLDRITPNYLETHISRQPLAQMSLSVRTHAHNAELSIFAQNGECEIA